PINYIPSRPLRSISSRPISTVTSRARASHRAAVGVHARACPPELRGARLGPAQTQEERPGNNRFAGGSSMVDRGGVLLCAPRARNRCSSEAVCAFEGCEANQDAGY